MIIVNTTFVIEPHLLTEVKQWMHETYEASAYRFGANPENTMLAKVLTAQTDDVTTYALHVAFTDLEAASKWGEGVAQKLRERASERWGEKVLTFHTYLEVE